MFVSLTPRWGSGINVGLPVPHSAEWWWGVYQGPEVGRDPEFPNGVPGGWMLWDWHTHTPTLYPAEFVAGSPPGASLGRWYNERFPLIRYETKGMRHIAVDEEPMYIVFKTIWAGGAPAIFTVHWSVRWLTFTPPA